MLSLILKSCYPYAQSKSWRSTHCSSTFSVLPSISGQSSAATT